MTGPLAVRFDSKKSEKDMVPIRLNRLWDRGKVAGLRGMMKLELNALLDRQRELGSCGEKF